MKKIIYIFLAVYVKFVYNNEEKTLFTREIPKQCIDKGTYTNDARFYCNVTEMNPNTQKKL